MNDAKARIQELTAKQLKEKLDKHHPFVLIDVREKEEWDQGHIATAIHLSKALLNVI